MPILYSVVSRGLTVLAKYASCAGNFAEVTEQILTKIAPEDAKLTYSHGSYLFHYICESRIIYMCITDDEFERSRAFLYLNKIKLRFKSAYGSRAETALAYAMNTEFSSVLANEMSVTFRKTSRNLQRQLFWKNVKLYVFVGLIIIVIVYFIISMSCGGLTWKNCV
uniref:Longin domain-containing protein n=2 Tax=Timema TaxID=61471 RepID=A0A7R9IEF5_9NEOP|nr:unnamed protein product [Timema bartmani]CAD7456740.1 unnamed protein product [Timema tahoe]